MGLLIQVNSIYQSFHKLLDTDPTNRRNIILHELSEWDNLS